MLAVPSASSQCAQTSIGHLHSPGWLSTRPEAERRAQALKKDLTARGVHPDVLRFCRAELVADNYFHAVLEATKSIADKLRNRTGLFDDGAIRAFGAHCLLLGDRRTYLGHAWKVWV